MYNRALQTVALRYRALYLNIKREDISMTSEPSAPVLAFVARLKENGFCVSEELLHALCNVSVNELSDITELINEVMEVTHNWAPLVKMWNVPTGESVSDHLTTWIANIFGGEKAGTKGTMLACGHFIPDGTFPLERYNGCPFCGTQFNTSGFVYKGQATKLKELRLFTEADMVRVYNSLLASATPLDGTQKDSLEKLLTVYSVPQNVTIDMKETLMFVIKTLVEHGKAEQAGKLLKTPADILRFLWFEKTGYVQIIEPKTLIANARKMYSHMFGPLDRAAEASEMMKRKLMLKYSRKECLRVASWINALPMSATQAAENMNPKRGMWVRMIRALRLGEYSHRRGFGHLAEILDVFYKHEYTTWQGSLDKARLENDADATLLLLKQRPGLFARCLFATMLRFGAKETMKAFDEIADKLPARLLLSLGNAAETYFNPSEIRIARPITGGIKRIPVNKLLNIYDEESLSEMRKMTDDAYRASMTRRFAAVHTDSKTMYIDPMLYNIPVSVGDRSVTVQDTSCALTGTRFHIQGNDVRLFLQWGKGLHTQDLDMDLSCKIAFENGEVKDCAFYNLVTIGAKHSGDIRSIPEMTGTAEYIELNIPQLAENHAKYVTFTCNAYSCGSLSPNLVVGWMDSAFPIEISEETGVAYDPSCVQHMVRVSEANQSKALVFGILDVESRDIIWLEMPFTSQTLEGCDTLSVEALLKRLEDKLSVGELLAMKASAQNLQIVDNAERADERYTYEWALNPAEVSLLLNI